MDRPGHRGSGNRDHRDRGRDRDVALPARLGCDTELRGAVPGVSREPRSRHGRAILLGLEFLVAADIVGTVVVDPTFENLGVLGLIVLIRTALSFALEVEINGHWPWQHSQRRAQAGMGP
jgi:hypothetical protein